MTDTPRNKSSLQTLFADNNVGNVSCQDLRDFVESVMGCYAGLYICEGSGTQNITTGAKLTINQWTNVQAVSGFTAVDTDQKLTIPTTGVYDISFHVTYQTTAVYDEVFKARITQNTNAIAGCCDRSVHYPASLSSPNVVYTAGARRLISLTAADELELEFEAGTLSATRTVAIKHASLVARLIG